MRSFVLLSLALVLAACGVQRPLMRPKDIPAYEEQQRKKRQEIIDEQKELDAIDAKRAAEDAAQRKAVVEPIN
jgi:predicted small lipoprotein YifL